jgi:hypothetical protein
MSNPWTKKNPLMSLWLSGANSLANRARGHATAIAKRESLKVVKKTAGLWASAWLADGSPKRRR